MLNTATTWLRPPRYGRPASARDWSTRCTTLAELISSPTSRKNGMASSASESTPSNIFCTIAGEGDVGEGRADDHAGNQRERHRHAE